MTGVPPACPPATVVGLIAPGGPSALVVTGVVFVVGATAFGQVLPIPPQSPVALHFSIMPFVELHRLSPTLLLPPHPVTVELPPPLAPLPPELPGVGVFAPGGPSAFVGTAVGFGVGGFNVGLGVALFPTHKARFPSGAIDPSGHLGIPTGANALLRIS